MQSMGTEGCIRGPRIEPKKYHVDMGLPHSPLFALLSIKSGDLLSRIATASEHPSDSSPYKAYLVLDTLRLLVQGQSGLYSLTGLQVGPFTSSASIKSGPSQDESPEPRVAQH